MDQIRHPGNKTPPPTPKRRKLVFDRHTGNADGVRTYCPTSPPPSRRSKDFDPRRRDLMKTQVDRLSANAENVDISVANAMAKVSYLDFGKQLTNQHPTPATPMTTASAYGTPVNSTPTFHTPPKHIPAASEHQQFLSPARSPAQTPSKGALPLQKLQHCHDPQMKRCEFEKTPEAHGFQEIGVGGISRIYRQHNSEHQHTVIKLPFNDATRMHDSIAQTSPHYAIGLSQKEMNIFEAIQQHAENTETTINNANAEQNNPVRLHVPKAALRKVKGRSGTTKQWHLHENSDRKLPLRDMLCIETQYCAGKHYQSRAALTQSGVFSELEIQNISNTLEHVYQNEKYAIDQAQRAGTAWIPVLDWKPDNILIEKNNKDIIIHLIDPGGDAVIFGLEKHDPNGKTLASGPLEVFNNNQHFWTKDWGFS